METLLQLFAAIRCSDDCVVCIQLSVYSLQSITVTIAPQTHITCAM